MLPHDQEALLSDILFMRERFASFAGTFPAISFWPMKKSSFAVIRCLEIIGEAVGRLSPEAQAVLSAHQLRNIRGMRNRLVHDYRNVSLRIIWEAASQDIPPLIQTLEGRVQGEP